MLRVCVFTGSRADYGPLAPLIRALDVDPAIDLRLLVSGGHLVEHQGATIERITADGFAIDERVDMVLATDSPTGVAKSFGLGVIGYADALERIDPDILIILGDRYEALAVAIAATFRLLPIAHIGGGQVTSGALDDSIRHAITQLAHLHFTATERFRRRVIQLGEDPDRVHTVGSLGLDTVFAAHLWDRAALAEKLDIPATGLLFAVTYHPATAESDQGRAGAEGMLTALTHFPDAAIVFTGTNVDGHGQAIAAMIRDYVADHPHQAVWIASMGHREYLSLVKHAHVVIGNSSSGLIEVPVLQTPTVNIGPRQHGRPRADSVIDCGENADTITQAIHDALELGGQQPESRWGHSLYGDGHAADKIVTTIKDQTAHLTVRKRFIDATAPDES